MFPGSLGCSLAGKALQNKTWKLSIIDIRKFAEDKNYRVDDAPFGGGSGMIMRPDILDSALKSLKLTKKSNHALIYPTPRGKVLDQSKVKLTFLLIQKFIIFGSIEKNVSKCIEIVFLKY